MGAIRILWADDEIDLLKAHLLFLKEKGYMVTAVNSGIEALALAEKEHFDVVFLDENMPGISGIETLRRLKEKKPNIPVTMITKSEEEFLMEDAIGEKIADYLIKPVHPKQILLSLKKTLDNKRLVSEKTTSNYQQEFRNIGTLLGGNLSWESSDGESWVDVYKQLVYWELELDKSEEESMAEVLKMQKAEANEQFSKYVEKHYTSWLAGAPNAPLFSHTIFKHKVLPELNKGAPVFLVLIDNLRFDQWKIIEPIVGEHFNITKEDTYCSILPTATQYARNAFFAGLSPVEIEKRFPKLWLNDEDQGGKNLHEEEFLSDQLNRLGAGDLKMSYTKITNHSAGKKLADNMDNLKQNDLNVIVYNFVDMLSHARTDMEVIRELADDEKAYRSLTLSWFEHSPLQDIIKQIAKQKSKLVITTDHGTIKVNEPSKVIGDKQMNTNLRYKQSKRFSYVNKDVLEVKEPSDALLPKQHVSSSFIFAKEAKFFVYQNDFNYYANYYKNTFQHGGISLEEMIIPFVTLSPK